LITRTIFGEEYRPLSSSLRSFLHSPVRSSLLGPNILLSTLFSYTFSLRSSLNVSDQVSHPNKTTGKIVIVYLSLHFCLANSSSSCSWRVSHVSCSLILKMKLVPPSLPRSSYVPSSFWFIL
jgi:hypothetical protein